MTNEHVEKYRALLASVRREFECALDEVTQTLEASLGEIEELLQTHFDIDGDTQDLVENELYGASAYDDGLSVQERINNSLQAQQNRNELSNIIQQQLTEAPNEAAEEETEEVPVVPSPPSLSDLIRNQVSNKPATEEVPQSPRTMREIIEDLKQSVAIREEYKTEEVIEQELEERLNAFNDSTPDNVATPKETLAATIQHQLLSEQIKKAITVNAGIHALTAEGAI